MRKYLADPDFWLAVLVVSSVLTVFQVIGRALALAS